MVIGLLGLNCLELLLQDIFDFHEDKSSDGKRRIMEIDLDRLVIDYYSEKILFLCSTSFFGYDYKIISGIDYIF